jgi:hypothetical protein
MQVEQTHATFNTLLDDLLEEVLLHVPLRSTDSRTRTENAVGLAMIRCFNANGFWEWLSKQCHRIGDDIRNHRTHRTQQRLSQRRHFLFLAASRKNPFFPSGKLANSGGLRQPQFRSRKTSGFRTYFFRLYAMKSS